MNDLAILLVGIKISIIITFILFFIVLFFVVLNNWRKHRIISHLLESDEGCRMLAESFINPRFEKH